MDALHLSPVAVMFMLSRLPQGFQDILKTSVGRACQCCAHRARQGATTTRAATPRGGATQYGAASV